MGVLQRVKEKHDTKKQMKGEQKRKLNKLQNPKELPDPFSSSEWVGAIVAITGEGVSEVGDDVGAMVCLSVFGFFTKICSAQERKKAICF